MNCLELSYLRVEGWRYKSYKLFLNLRSKIEMSLSGSRNHFFFNLGPGTPPVGHVGLILHKCNVYSQYFRSLSKNCNNGTVRKLIYSKMQLVEQEFEMYIFI